MQRTKKIFILFVTLVKNVMLGIFQELNHNLSRVVGCHIQICQKVPHNIELEVLQAIGITPTKKAKIEVSLKCEYFRLLIFKSI